MWFKDLLKNTIFSKRICKKCNSQMDKKLYLCSSCGFHDYIPPRERLSLMLDSYEEVSISSSEFDPLGFEDIKSYKEKIKESKKETRLDDAAIVVRGIINNREVIIFCMDFKFMGGSMGKNVGNSFCYGSNIAIENNLPYIAVVSSGGARVQEGVSALMQMSKTVAAVNRINKARIPYITILTYPTLGGTAASFSALGDICIVEKDAIVGFTGRRVIEGTTREKLGDDFQTPIFQKENGMIDCEVHRKDIKENLIKILSII